MASPCWKQSTLKQAAVVVVVAEAAFVAAVDWHHC